MAITDIITPTWLKSNYLFGIDLTDDDGNAYPDSLYQIAIDAATGIIAAEFDIELLGPNRYMERHDTFPEHGNSFYLMTLMHRPLITVEAFNVKFGEWPQRELPVRWIQQSNPEHSQIQVVPGPEGVDGVLYSGGVPFVGISGLEFRDYTPLWWMFTYTAGFECDMSGTVSVAAGETSVTGASTKFLGESIEVKDSTYGGIANKPGARAGYYLRIGAGNTPVRIKSVTNDTTLVLDGTINSGAEISGSTATLLYYPPEVMDCVGLIASMLPLDTAGDLIIGAGISRLNLGVDGLHQEIQTTSGVENSGYGARVIQYRRRLAMQIAALRRRYRQNKIMVM